MRTYKTISGLEVPSVTTVLNIINRLEDVRNYYLDIGSNIHEIIAHYLRYGVVKNFTKSENGEIQELTPVEMVCLEKFIKWWESQNLEPLLIEQEFVSQKLLYGGTLDLYCKDIDTGKRIVVDFKTSKEISTEYLLQVSAYSLLLQEHGFPVDYGMVVKISKDKNEPVEVQEVHNLEFGQEIFLKILDLFYILKGIEGLEL